MKKKLSEAATEMTPRTSSASGASTIPTGGVEEAPSAGENGETGPAPSDRRVKFSTSYAKDAHEALKRSLQLAENSNIHGEHAIVSLGKQREVIQNSLNNVGETHETLRGSRRALREMKFAQWKEAGLKALVILGLVAIILFIIHAKWGKKR